MSKKYMGIIILICLFLLISTNTYSSSIKEDYELQERCGKRCEEYFKKEFGNGIISNEEVSGVKNFQNHYNKKLNKCFILITDTGFIKNNNKIYKSKSLLDINEKKDYGFFYNYETFIICNVLEKNVNLKKNGIHL